MLTCMSVEGLDHMPKREFGFTSGLNVVHGPVGSGKSMVLRDVLFLLLAGKVPGKRKLASLGKKMRLSVGMERGDESLTIYRTGSTVSVMERPDLTSSSDVTAAVATFLGVPSSQLVDRCYVSGLTLPASVLTAGSVLSAVRGAIGSAALTAFAKDVNAVAIRKKSESDQCLGASVQSVPEGMENIDNELGGMRADLAKVKADIEASREGKVTSQQVLGCQLDTDVAARIDQMLEHLGAWADRGDARAVLGEASGYMFLKRRVDMCLHDEVKIEDLKRFSYLLEAYYDASCLESNGAGNPGELLQALDHLKQCRTMTTTTSENKKNATQFLVYCQKLDSRANLLAADIRGREELRKSADQIRSQKESNRVRAAELGKQATTLITALEFLQPSGPHSVEKRLCEARLAGVMGYASELMQAAGVAGKLRYSADDGLSLERGNGNLCPVAELSGGEVTLAALVLRLSQDLKFSKVPFLILDDITGPLGDLTSGVCDMLIGHAARMKSMIVLPTHDRRARGDNIIAF